MADWSFTVHLAFVPPRELCCRHPFPCRHVSQHAMRDHLPDPVAIAILAASNERSPCHLELTAPSSLTLICCRHRFPDSVDCFALTYKSSPSQTAASIEARSHAVEQLRSLPLLSFPSFLAPCPAKSSFSNLPASFSFPFPSRLARISHHHRR